MKIALLGRCLKLYESTAYSSKEPRKKFNFLGSFMYVSGLNTLSIYCKIDFQKQKLGR